MIDCEECGKNLVLLECYRHPTLGKNHLLYSTCFDIVSVNVDNLRGFVNANSSNNASSNTGLKIDLNKIFTSFSKNMGIILKYLWKEEIQILR